MNADFTIIGAGIIGSATAYELANRGVKNIHVFDLDLQGEFSSTERNAGGVRHLWQNKINIQLSQTTISLLENIAHEVGFIQSGYLWLFSTEQENLAKKILTKTKEENLSYQFLTPNEIQKRYPFLDRIDDLSCAIYGIKDGLVNANALKDFFRKEAKKQGVLFHDHSWITSIQEENSHCILTIQRIENESIKKQILQSPSSKTSSDNIIEEKQISSRKIILTAGAWMQPLLQNLIPAPLIHPVRRQIAVFQAEGFHLKEYGMIVDPSRVYFHPEGEQIIAGKVIHEEPSSFSFRYDDPSFFENEIWPSLAHRSSKLERLRLTGGWAGLYSYTPDTTGILGLLPKYQHIYEAHSFTGRGLMQSYGVAVALSDLILEKKKSPIDASCLHRDRFLTQDRSKWLFEDLHL